MNDWTGFLGGHPQAMTPNMDSLARRGVNFTNAHCVVPACSPSRLALMYGVEPFNSGLYPFYKSIQILEPELAQFTSLPMLYKKNGYQTFGAGKVHHKSEFPEEEWTESFVSKKKKLVFNAKAGYRQGRSRKLAFCPTKNPLKDHHDYQVASFGVDVLSREHDDPFFLAVGIVKPHLPFVCPEPYFDLYDEPIQPPAIKADDLADVPWAGRAMSMNYIRHERDFRQDEAWEIVRRAYLACNSWVDYNVGRILEALAQSPYADNTIVVLWSDHGFHLGEKRSFKKFTLWEEATRVPFIIWDTRDGSAPLGRECKEAVSLINVYRTLADLSGLETPEYVDGVSLRPQLADPSIEIDEPAIITWGRGNYAIRDEDWRYIRYFDGSEELYSHQDDPNEWNNLAEMSEHEATKRYLASFLPEHEAPLIRTGIGLWNSVDADQPDLEKTKSIWAEINETLTPPLD
ncbi:MAG: sulfatase [Planctomycetota bacterium]|nr:sulfatase [Planctomycetota bacterium]